MADRVVATEKTRQAIEAAESGDIEASRALLAEALTADPDYELAWLWFAAVTDDVGEERFCLERARDLDPTHRTSPALARLRAHEAVSPAELTAFVDPPPPDFITGYAEQARSRRRRRAWIRTIAVVVALALVAGVIALIAHSRVRYTDIAVVVAHSTGRRPSPRPSGRSTRGTERGRVRIASCASRRITTTAIRRRLVRWPNRSWRRANMSRLSVIA